MRREEADRDHLAWADNSCKQAIHVYWPASRTAANVNPIYLDSHPHVAVTPLSRDVNRRPYTTLKMHTFRAKSEAIRVRR